jgi:hypothetical protein
MHRYAAALTLLSLFLTTAASAAPGAPTVLLLWDSKGPPTEALIQTLQDSGVKVVLSDTNEGHWDGTNPSLAGMDVVVHLNGTTWQVEMPKSGQKALVDFVRDGGGYVHHEWNSYQLSVGQMLAMREIILFDRTSGYAGEITISRYETQGVHPVTWEVPPTFKMNGSCNIGKVHVFTQNPVTVLARDQNGNDAVAIRELGRGRVVGFHHGGNWQWHAGKILDSQDARRLFVDGVKWAHGCTNYYRKGTRDNVCSDIEASRKR